MSTSCVRRSAGGVLNTCSRLSAPDTRSCQAKLGADTFAADRDVGHALCYLMPSDLMSLSPATARALPLCTFAA